MSIESDAFELYEQARKGIAVRFSPCCNGPCLEIFTLEHPTGYTGIYRCLVCDALFDPTWRQTNDDAR